jgi:ADP-ribose pyrophosphatase
MSDIMKPWEELSREEVFRKYGRGIERRTYRLPHGTETDFYLSTGHDSVCCLALTRSKEAILVRQFRPGPGEVLLEMPGGGVADGENCEEGMARELLEETGYRGKMEFVTEVFPSAYSTYRKRVFVANDCVKVADPEPEDNGEELEVVLMSIPEFREHLRSGKLTDVEMGYLALDHLGLL